MYAGMRAGRSHGPRRRRGSGKRARHEPFENERLPGHARLRRRSGRHQALRARAARPGPVAAAQRPCRQEHPLRGLRRRVDGRLACLPGGSGGLLPHRPHRSVRNARRHGGLQRQRRAFLPLRRGEASRERPSHRAGRRPDARPHARAGQGARRRPQPHDRAGRPHRGPRAHLHHALREERLGLLRRARHGRGRPVRGKRRHPGRHLRD